MGNKAEPAQKSKNEIEISILKWEFPKINGFPKNKWEIDGSQHSRIRCPKNGPAGGRRTKKWTRPRSSNRTIEVRSIPPPPADWSPETKMGPTPIVQWSDGNAQWAGGLHPIRGRWSGRCRCRRRVMPSADGAGWGWVRGWGAGGSHLGSLGSVWGRVGALALWRRPAEPRNPNVRQGAGWRSACVRVSRRPGRGVAMRGRWFFGSVPAAPVGREGESVATENWLLSGGSFCAH